MIELPACFAGRLISPKPAWGPELRRRRSLQIFDSFMAVRLSVAETVMNTPVSLVASMRSAALRRPSMPVMRRRCSRTAGA